MQDTNLENSILKEMYCEYCVTCLSSAFPIISEMISNYKKISKWKKPKRNVTKEVASQLVYYIYYRTALEINNCTSARWEDHFTYLCRNIKLPGFLKKNWVEEAEANAKLYYMCSSGDYEPPAIFSNSSCDHTPSKFGPESELLRFNVAKCFLLKQFGKNPKADPIQSMKLLIDYSLISIWTERFVYEYLPDYIDMFDEAVNYKEYVGTVASDN